MQYSKLGNTGLIVSRLSFGAMTFGKGAGLFASVSKVEEDAAQTMIGKALDAGINFFDTAIRQDSPKPCWAVFSVIDERM